jgi:hypothetical protein
VEGCELESCGSGYSPVAGPCENSNEPLGSTKCIEFVDLSMSNSKYCPYSDSISTYTEVLVLPTFIDTDFNSSDGRSQLSIENWATMENFLFI